MYKLLSFAILSALLISGCSDDDENNGRGESINDFKLTSPTNFSTITLNPSTPNATIVLSWEGAKTGLSSAPTYHFLLDEKGGDFSTPVFTQASDNDGMSNRISLSSSALKDAIAGSATSDFIWTVEATTENSQGSNTKRATNHFDIKINVSSVGISSFSYTGPSVNQKLELNKLLSPNSEIEFSWTAATSTAGAVTYTWQAATTVNGFNNPVLEYESDSDGAATTFTITQGQLVDALADIDYTDGLFWRVTATVNNFSFAPAAQFVWFDIVNITEAFVVGSLNGWNNGCGSVISLDNKGGGVFEKLVNVSAGTEFKFLLNCGSWDNAYGFTSTAAPSLGVDHATGGDNILITDAGSYFLRINFVNMTFRVTKFNPPANLFLVGGATSAGWSPPNSIPFRKISEGYFEIFANINSGDGFKFLQVQDWAGDWGKSKTEAGKVVQEDEDNVTVETSGFYRVRVNFADFSYETVKTTWGLIGAATPGGWGTDTDMTYQGGYTWSIDVMLGAGEWKFRANDDWGINMGQDSGMTLRQDGGNFVNSTPGSYHIEMILSPITGYTYTITPN